MTYFPLKQVGVHFVGLDHSVLEKEKNTRLQSYQQKIFLFSGQIFVFRKFLQICHVVFPSKISVNNSQESAPTSCTKKSTYTIFLLHRKTRPVWTGFKIAVRRKLLTHYYKVRCLDAIIICNN